jgi:ATP-dependent DNA helicase RecG
VPVDADRRPRCRASTPATLQATRVCAIRPIRRRLKKSSRFPRIIERDHSVLVEVRHESLASPAQQVVDFLKSNPTIKNETARRLTGIDTESKMKKVFERLIEADEIEHAPGTAGRGYAYQLKK